MEIIKKLNTRQQTVVALGNFDGLHKAHTEVIKKCVEEAYERDVKSTVLLFFEHTQNITENINVKLLTDLDTKLEILDGMGVDIVFMKHFTREFMELSPAEFVDFLHRELNPVALCAGYDYRFGHKAEGNIKTLKELCRGKGIDVFITDEVKEGETPVKSTAIRQYLASGEVEKANALLGRNFALRGEVKKGFQNGRKIGVPTANVGVLENIILPLDGVYMGYTKVEGKKYKSLINVGNNPTVNGKDTTVESHILDFSGDIYGKVIEVEFCKRLRGEIKFASLEELKKQIEKDLERVIQCI